PKVWLLIEDNEQMSYNPDDERVQHKRRCPEEHCPTQDDGKYPQVHRVSRVPIQPPNDQPFRGVDGRRRTTSEAGEVPEAPEVDRPSDDDESQRCQDVAERTDRLAASDEPRKIAGDRPGNNERDSKILEEQEHRSAALADGILVAPDD